MADDWVDVPSRQTSNDWVDVPSTGAKPAPKAAPAKKTDFFDEIMPTFGGEIVFRDPAKQAQYERGKIEGYKGAASGLAQIPTGIGELVPGPVGRASAEATKYLKGVGAPQMQTPAGMVGSLALPFGVVTRFAKPAAEGLPFLARTWQGVKTGVPVGAAAGAITPTGKTEESERYKEKGISALIGAGLGGLFGGAGAAIFGRRPFSISSEDLVARMRETGEGMAEAAKRLAESRAGRNTKAAQDLYEATIKENRQLLEAEAELGARRIISAKGKVKEIVPPEQQTIEAVARQQTNLPNVGNLADDVERLAQQKYAEAIAKQKSGGDAYGTFADAARAKEAVAPFEATAQGQALLKELTTIERGGEEALVKYTDAERKVAGEIIRELFPRQATAVSEQAVAARAAQNTNVSMSPAAKMIEARRELEAKAASEASKARPVNFEVIKTKAQELRALQEQRGGPTGFKVQVGERYKTPAEKIEGYLKEWVGEKNWPHSIYAASSKEANRFRTGLGDVLAKREEIPYSKEPGRFVTARKDVPEYIFRNKDNLQEARALLGDAETNALAERYAVSQIEGMTSDKLQTWMKKNDFYKVVPGLEEKLNRYAEKIAQREKDVAAMAVLRGEREKSVEAIERQVRSVLDDVEKQAQVALKSKDAKVSEVGEAFKKFTDTIREFQTTLAGDPANLAKKWPEIRARLEETRLFAPSELNMLQNDLVAAGRQAEVEIAKAARMELIRDLLKYKIAKAGLGVIGFGGGYGLYKAVK